MITKTENFQDTVVGADAEMTFTIDTDSSVIFEVLRDKMYKDKIGAIAREVASNSRDANREAESDKPVEIEVISPNKLLSMGHLSISFKDYGKGIPPNKMADIYLKYGASDKRTTNKLTGGFGLGAKTPFAYNDTFTVITIADYNEERREYKYTAMLDSSGKGKMVLFSDQITDKETGTQIIVPLKSESDRYKFERDVLKYTKTWEDVVYKNFMYTPDVLETAYDDEDVTIYKTNDYQNETMQLLIDGIPYPLDKDIVGVVDTIGRANSYYLTVLKFDTGDLSISANRESVQYDEETIAAIKVKVNELHAKLDELATKHVEDQETYLEACVVSYYLNRASSNMANPPALTGAVIAHTKSIHKKLKNLTWRGMKTVDVFRFRHHTAYFVKEVNGRNNYEPVREFHLNQVNTDSPVYYGDVRKNSSRNVNLWNDGHKSFYLIKPDDLESKEGIQEFMDFIFTFDIDFDIYSSLEVVKSARTSGTYQKKSYVTLNVRDSWADKKTLRLERKTFERTNGKDFSKVVYLPVQSLSRANYAYGRDKLKWLESNAGYKGYIVRQQDVDNWFSKTDMKHVDEVYEEERTAYEKRILEQKKHATMAYLLYNAVDDAINTEFLEEVKGILPESVRNVEYAAHVGWDIIDIVKKELKFDFEGLKKKIRFIFEEQYPIVHSIMRNHTFNVDKRKKLIKDYLKTV